VCVCVCVCAVSVCVTVGRPSVRLSVCLFHRSTTTTAAGGFAAERRRLREISVDSCGRRTAGAAGAQQEMRVASC